MGETDEEAISSVEASLSIFFRARYATWWALFLRPPITVLRYRRWDALWLARSAARTQASLPYRSPRSWALQMKNTALQRSQRAMRRLSTQHFNGRLLAQVRGRPQHAVACSCLGTFLRNPGVHPGFSF